MLPPWSSRAHVRMFLRLNCYAIKIPKSWTYEFPDYLFSPSTWKSFHWGLCWLFHSLDPHTGKLSQLPPRIARKLSRFPPGCTKKLTELIVFKYHYHAHCNYILLSTIGNLLKLLHSSTHNKHQIDKCSGEVANRSPTLASMRLEK